MDSRHKAFLVILLLLYIVVSNAQQKNFTYVQGAIVRGDSAKKELALVFTADEFGEGLPRILQTLQKEKVKAGFFFTGRFYRNAVFQSNIKKLQQSGHYLGPHSDQHLLYCDWTKRDSLLVTKDSFDTDLANNIAAMKALAIPVPRLFIPPYEWWNDSIAAWSEASGFQLFNFTPGIRTPADYTWPEMGTAYKSSESILKWLQNLLDKRPQELNGAIVLIHAGTDPKRKDKLYEKLLDIILLLKEKGFVFRRIDELLK